MSCRRQPIRAVCLAGFGAALATLVAPSAQADTLTVGDLAGNDFTTIQAAIDAASNGDEILVAPGTYEENIDFLTKSIIVRGDGGPKTTQLVGTGSGPVVIVGPLAGASTVFDGFSVTGGDSRADPARPGGCVHIEGSSPTLRDLVLFECSARLGGGLQLVASESRVEDVAIFDTTAEADGDEWGLGGGIYVLGGAPTFERITITETTARTGGGAFLQSTSVTATEVVITDAVAERTGGLHVAGDGTPGLNSFTTLEITGNRANEGAGGLRALGGGTLSVTAGRIVDNSADRGGGARFSGVDFSLARTFVADNRATSAAGGGGLRIDGAAVGTCDRCVVAGNTAEFGAGALVEDASPTFVRSRFVANRAEGGAGGFGGALYLLGADVVVRTTLFDGNRAQREGGAIRVEGSGISRVSSSLFVHNRADAGATAHVLSGSLDLTHVTLAGNRSDEGADLRVTGDGSLSMLHGIVAFPERGDGISAGAGAVTSLRWSNVFVPDGSPYAGDLADLTGTVGNVSVNPSFVDFTAGDDYDDRLELGAQSPLRDAGDAAAPPDPDGSRPDLGAFGGPDGGTWEDVDQDGDGWNPLLGDCDDANPARHPGREKGCEGTDEDCDHLVDEECGGDDDDVADDDDGADDDDAVDRNPYIPPREDDCGCTTAVASASAVGPCLVGLFVYLSAARRRRRA